MTKQNRNNLLTALQVACEEVSEVRVYTEIPNMDRIYEPYVYLYSTDGPATVFKKTLKLLNSGVKGLYEIKYIREYNMCEICVR